MKESNRCTIAQLFTIFSLHSLLWSSILALSIIIYFNLSSKVEASLFLTDILFLSSAGLSLLTIFIHILVVRIQDKGSSSKTRNAVPFLRIFCYFLSGTTVLMWIASVGLGIILTIVRHPSCSATSPTWTKCVLQRTALAAAMSGLISSSILCLTHQLSSNSFTTTLSGLTQPNPTPDPNSSDPEKRPHENNRKSSLSFKCRSSTSLIMIPPPSIHSQQDPLTTGPQARLATPTLPILTEKPISALLPSLNEKTHLKSNPSNASNGSSDTAGTANTLTGLLPREPKPVVLKPRRTAFHRPLDAKTLVFEKDKEVEKSKGAEQMFLSPPPQPQQPGMGSGFRKLASASIQRAASFASRSSSVYSRNTGDEL